MFKNLLTLLNKRASLENPKTTLAEYWGEEIIGTESGVPVTRDSSLKLAPFWRALDLLSSDIGRLPLEVLAREGSGKDRAKDHSLYNLLRYQPNEEVNAYDFKVALAYQALMGNGYAAIERSESTGRVISLILLDSTKVKPVRIDGKLHYLLRGTTHKDTLFEASEIIHVHSMAWNGIEGEDTLKVMKDVLSSGLANRKFSARFFKNNARPSLVLQHPSSFSSIEVAERLRKSWEKAHRGVDQSNRVAILEEGMQAKVISSNARESQLIEAAEFSLIEVALFFGIPASKLGSKINSSYSSLESENQQYLDHALDKWLVSFEMEFRNKLLPEREKNNDSHIIEFDREKLVEADLSAKTEYFRTALGGAPWLTINEVRNSMNLPSLDQGDGFGETLILPSNNFAQFQDDDPTTEEIEVDSDNARMLEGAAEIREQVVSRMVNRISNEAKRITDREGLLTFLSTYRSKHRPVLEDALSPICKMLALDLDKEVEGIFRNFEPLVGVEIDQITNTLKQIQG